MRNSEFTLKTLSRKIDGRLRRTSRPLAGVAPGDKPHAESQLRHPLSLLKRLTFITLAGLFLLLGVVGVFLPVLPTTPFLLLTSYFLLRAWPSMNARLLRSRLLGGFLRDWQQRGGVRRHVKLKAIVLVGATVCAGLLLVEMAPLVRGVLACGAMTGLLVIRRLPEVAAD